MSELPRSARAYIAAVIVAGVAVLVVSVAHLRSLEQWMTVIPLALLVAVADYADSPLRRERGVRISVSGPVTLASVLLLGPYGGAVVAVATVLGDRGRRVARAFNGGMLAITAAAAGFAYQGLGGPPLATTHTYEPLTVLVPWLVTAVVYEAVNGLLMVGIISLERRASPLQVWFGTFAGSAMPMFVYSVFGLLLAVVWSFVGPISAVLVLAPLAVARWVFAEFALRQEAYEATMRSLIKAVETKDFYTRGHSERVSTASVMIGRRSGMREDRVDSLRYAGMLHDVGKLGVPTDVLQASGRLTDEQYEAIQQHPVRGREITKDLEFLGEAIEGIHLHHERIDGRGYPLGLKGSEIPEFARIIAVADAFDSMTTTRSYRGARSIDEAVTELRECKGSQFDPVMVEALIEAIGQHGWVLADTSQPPTPLAAAPSFGSDDDDPSVARQLGLVPTSVPDDASSLDDEPSPRGRS
ncbi:MAG TPA: HD-GYP domain-containing protein [Candidatus Nanopelagicales bacterium]|nr:HD-GYP domain-containing protein [Candidatus Nanopelagicales bacterium]